MAHIELTDEELEQVKYALDYLHDANLSGFGESNVKALESAMDKLGVKYSPWEDLEFVDK